MKYIFGIISFLVCFFAAFSLASGGFGFSAPFDYDVASKSERAAWLERQAKPIARGVRHGLPKGFGASPRMELSRTIVRPDRREIEFIIQIKGRAMLASGASRVRHQFLQKTCPLYVGMPLYEAGVTVKHSIKYSNGRNAMTFTNTPSKCRAVTAGL